MDGKGKGGRLFREGSQTKEKKSVYGSHPFQRRRSNPDKKKKDRKREIQLTKAVNERYISTQRRYHSSQRKERDPDKKKKLCWEKKTVEEKKKKAKM